MYKLINGKFVKVDSAEAASKAKETTYSPRKPREIPKNIIPSDDSDMTDK